LFGLLLDAEDALANHLAAAVEDADAPGLSVVVVVAVEEGEVARVVLDARPLVLRKPGYGGLSARGGFCQMVSGAYGCDIDEADIVGKSDGEGLGERVEAFYNRPKLLGRLG
jgi:hypothetical protein